MSEKEIWITCKENENYEVSNLGRIRKISDWVIRNCKNGQFKCKRSKKEIFGSSKISKNGYCRVVLGSKEYYTHRVVANNFLPNPNSLPQVNHKNGIKIDNRVENLEWVTSQENIAHSVRNKLNAHGETCGYNKLTEREVLEIRSLYGKFNGTELSLKYKVSKSTIYEIVKRYIWKHV